MKWDCNYPFYSAYKSFVHQVNFGQFKLSTDVETNPGPSFYVDAIKTICALYTWKNEDIFELKGVHIANIEVDLCSSSVEYCSISNVDSLYQCCCKQCCAIAVYTMSYSVINPCGHWTSGTLSALAINGNTLYNVMGVKRHIMPVDLPHFWQKRIFVSKFFLYAVFIWWKTVCL